MKLTGLITGVLLLTHQIAAQADSFSPPAAAPGATVTLSGQAKPNSAMSGYFSCAAGCGQTHLGVAQVNAQGEYALTFRIPANAVAGAASVQIGCDTCGNGWRTVGGLQVQNSAPAEGFSPATAAPGSTVTLSGRAKPNSAMSGYFTCSANCGQTHLGVAQVDAQGNYALTFKVPANAVAGAASVQIGCDTCGNGWRTIGGLQIQAVPQANPGANAGNREQMIKASYFDAFGRAPSSGELSYWMSVPGSDPRVANAGALFANHLNWLRQNPAESENTARRALHEVFKVEEASFPRLRAYLDTNGNAAALNAVLDMQAGREGGGYKGILVYLSRPEVKKWYVDNKGVRGLLVQAPSPAPAPVPAPNCAENTAMLVAFDGTQTIDTDRSSIWQLFNRFTGIGACPGFKRYIKGPNMMGNDQGPIYDVMKADACNDIVRNNVRKVFVIGFSRGAINAMRFANEFNCAPNAKITFIGVSDPVDALLVGYDSNKQLQAGKAGASYKIVKASNDHWVTDVVNANFITTGAPGFAKAESLQNSEQSRLSCGNKERHWMMNAHNCASGKEVERRLVQEMSALGVSFSNADVPGREACNSGNGYGAC